MAQRIPKNQSPATPSIDPTGLKFWATAIKELGIPSFIVLFFVIVFITFSEPAQKKEFIDKFFLLKDVQNNPFPFSLVVLVLLLIIILQYIFYNKLIKVHKEENNKLGIEKSELQQVLLNRKLNTSK